MRSFLAEAGWAGADAQPLAGDASARRYTRLTRSRGSAILMEDPDGDVARFAALSGYLRGLGLSAPAILAMDAAAGLMLLEDLGDALFARCDLADPGTEIRLYRVATDVLVALHAAPAAPGLTEATPERLGDMTDLAFDWYLTRAGRPPAPGAKAEAADALASLLRSVAPRPEVTVLRDYHAENLLWLPDRAGPARAGLLDFQDALLGHRAYDLVSLLQDARRDVSAAARDAAIGHYLAETGTHPEDFRAALAALGAQRNLRILGVFARLAATRGKAHYIDLLPRVWAHLQHDLAHPVLADLRAVLACLPAPEPAILERLRAPCPTPR